MPAKIDAFAVSIARAILGGFRLWNFFYQIVKIQFQSQGRFLGGSGNGGSHNLPHLIQVSIARAILGGFRHLRGCVAFWLYRCFNRKGDSWGVQAPRQGENRPASKSFNRKGDSWGVQAKQGEGEQAGEHPVSIARAILGGFRPASLATYTSVLPVSIARGGF